jgi:regulator of replication initiation timing
VNSDPLKEILRAALAEAASPEGLDRFVDAFRERARMVLADRVVGVEERMRVLEEELGWRQESLLALERELRSALDENGRLRQEAEGLRREWRAASEAHDRLKQEAEALLSDTRASAQAHDRLLAHHRALVAGLADGLENIAAGMPAGEPRERLRAQAAALRRELP